MLLKALELQGFKSFPDKTTLEFGKGITAVIGPNGSGKSNISDAVRWVLGEQSSKSLRGSKMEDVIFGGTSLRKAMGFAEVTLRLDNADRTLNNCDKDEVSVTRRYYRSGESEYQLNGETVRLRDIHELFMDTGLGRDGYSMVSQGRVADLISSRSPQRRDMLEEAAGISHFRYRRADATRRLEQAEENLVRLRDILTELEGRVGPLKTQSEKAQKFLVLAGEKKELEIGLWLKTIERSREGLRAQEDKISLAAADYEQAERELERISAQIEELMSTGSGITVQIEELRTKAASDEEQATAVDGRIAVERNNLSHNRETIERIQRDMEAATATEQHLDDQITVAEKEIAEINGQIENCRLQLLELLDSTGKLKEQESAITAERDSAEAQAKTVNAALSAARIEQSTARSSAEEIAARMSTVDEVIASRGGLLDALREQAEVSRKNLDACLENIESLSNSIDGYSMIVRSRAEKAEKLRRELDAATLDIHQKQARIRMLEDLEKNMEGYSGSVKAVMREAKRATLRGIHGPVSQLITVDAKYAAAVETALGAAVQNIVTDDEAAAKRAIAYLKESRAGRATFLPMTTIKPRPFREDGLDSCAGFIDMADRLLRCDDEYLPIIKSLLGHTAVADNIDSAIAISKRFGHRFKVVTLDGQVMNAGGSMTGGSRGQNAGILSRGNDIEQLKKTVAKLEKELAERQEKYKELSEEVSAAQAEYDGVTAELQKAQEEKIRREGELRMIDDKIETSESALNDLEAEKKNAAERTAKLEKIRAQAQEKIDGLTAELDRVTEKITEIDSRRDELLSTREQNADMESSINLSILAFKKDVQAKEEAIGTLKRRRSSHEGHADELKAEIDSITEQMAATNELIEQLKVEAAGLREEAQQKKDEISELVRRRSGVEGESTKLRSQERSVSDRRERLSGERARLEERRDSMQRELENAQNKLYDEYQLTRREAEELGIVIEDAQKAQRDLNDIKNKIRALGNVNVGAIEEYKEVSERYEFMKTQIDDVESSRAELLALIGDLTGKMSERFREQFDRINSIFGQTFSELFSGGKAELILENPLDVLECAIEIKVQPPGKNVQNIDLLSGGEKGLAAIALLFSILKVTPAPFCFFDEVEAALDDVNVTRYAQYARRMTKNTQFILITHRRGTMEEADVLYGVTMQEDGVSKLLELKTAEMAKKLGLTQ